MASRVTHHRLAQQNLRIARAQSRTWSGTKCYLNLISRPARRKRGSSVRYRTLKLSRWRPIKLLSTTKIFKRIYNCCAIALSALFQLRRVLVSDPHLQRRGRDFTSFSSGESWTESVIMMVEFPHRSVCLGGGCQPVVSIFSIQCIVNCVDLLSWGMLFVPVLAWLRAALGSDACFP